MYLIFTTFHEQSRSHLIANCQPSETRFQFKGNFEVICRNDGCRSIL